MVLTLYTTSTHMQQVLVFRTEPDTGPTTDQAPSLMVEDVGQVLRVEFLGESLQHVHSCDILHQVFSSEWYLGKIAKNIYWIFYDYCLLLTLKAPRKKESKKWCLLKSSAANNCLKLLTNLSIEANRVDPDQTAPIGAV